jgi:uncharacterized membrane protein
MQIIHFIHFLLLSIWIGGISIFSFVTAPAIFKTSPSREQAGKVVGEILRSFTWVQVVVVVGLFLTFHFLFGGTLFKNRLAVVTLAVLVAMAVFLVLCSFVLGPQMEKIRASTPDFYRLTKDNPIRIAYQRFHSRYVRLTATNLFFGLFLLGSSLLVLRDRLGG